MYLTLSFYENYFFKLFVLWNYVQKVVKTIKDLRSTDKDWKTAKKMITESSVF